MKNFCPKKAPGVCCFLGKSKTSRCVIKALFIAFFGFFLFASNVFASGNCSFSIDKYPQPATTDTYTITLTNNTGDTINHALFHWTPSGNDFTNVSSSWSFSLPNGENGDNVDLVNADTGITNGQSVSFTMTAYLGDVFGGFDISDDNYVNGSYDHTVCDGHIDQNQISYGSGAPTATPVPGSEDTPTSTPAPGVTETPGTPTPVITIINKNILVTPVPTPTPVPDTTPPAVSVSTDFSKPFLVSPKITGKATDNKGVARVEYSLDGGKNFLPVDALSAPGKLSTDFYLTPPVLDDGNYSLVVKATDLSGNPGISKTYTIVIDRLPPEVSGALFSLGPQIINPDQDGNLMVLEKEPVKITLSEVGGTTSINLTATNTQNASKTIALVKNPDSGLWSGDFSLAMPGEYSLKAILVDGANNKTEKDLNKILVAKKGLIGSSEGVVAGAKITVYYEDPVSKTWQVWDGAPYSQVNPQTSDENGTYSLFLPAGNYYLHLESYDYKSTDTQFFAISNPTPINMNFSLEKLNVLFSFGFIKLYYPDFSVVSASFQNNLPQLVSKNNSFLNTQAPVFSLKQTNGNDFSSNSLSGKPSVLTFLNTWSPSSQEQISVLDKLSGDKNFNVEAIVEGEKLSKVYVFQKRGAYNLSMLVDSDATLFNSYNLNSLPVSYFLDRSGVVRKVVFGIMNKEELVNTLTNIQQ